MSEKSETGDARRRILEAAEALFAAKGFAATRVQEITDAAGVNKALLYYYFQDKGAVYRALIEDAVAAFAAVVEAALASPGTYSERLAVLVRKHVELLFSRPNLLRVLQRSSMPDEVDATEWRAGFRAPLGRVEAFFSEGIASGDFAAYDPRMLAVSLISLNTGFARASTQGLEDLTPEQVAAHVTQLLRSGVVCRQAPNT